MTEVGKLIRKERLRQGLRQGELAQRAQELPEAPEITDWHVGQVERVRTTFRFDDPDDPLRWCIRALSIPGDRVLRAMGL